MLMPAIVLFAQVSSVHAKRCRLPQDGCDAINVVEAGQQDRDSDMSIAMAPDKRRLFLVERHYQRLMLVAGSLPAKVGFEFVRIANCEAASARRFEDPTANMLYGASQRTALLGAEQTYIKSCCYC